RFAVHSLSANKNIERLLEQCLEFKPSMVVVVDENAARKFREKISQASELKNIQVLSGKDSLEIIARSDGNNTVMASIVGAAGLRATLAAAEASKRILLANKEALVMSGSLFMNCVRQHGAE